MPRPRKFKEPVNQTVTFDETELVIIKHEAHRARESVSSFIRRMLLQAMGREEGQSSIDDSQ